MVVVESVQHLSRWLLSRRFLALLPLVIVGAGLGYVVYRRTALLGERARGSGPLLVAPLLSTSFLSSVPAGLVFTPRYRLRKRALYSLLALVNVGALLGLVLAIESGRVRFFGMTLVVAVGVALLDLLVAVPYDREGAILASPTRPRLFWRVLQDRRFAVSALLVSVAVVATLGRGIVFFLLVAVFFTSITVRILLSNGEPSIAPNLSLIAIGGGLLPAVQTLTVPYYVRTSDTIYHMTLARHIAAAGSLAPIGGTRYEDLMVFHTLASLVTQLSGLSPRHLVAALIVVLFSVAIVVVFAVFRNVTGSAKIALVGAVIVATTPDFIGWGSQVHAQSLSFFFLTVFLLLFSKWARDVRYTAIAVVVTLAWVMTHHLSVFMGVVLIGTWAIGGALWALVVDRSYWTVIRRPFQQYTLLTLAVAVYWWVTFLYLVPVRWITEFSPAASSGAPTEQFLIQLYSSPVELARASVGFVIMNIHFAFFIALAGYGLWTVVREGGTMPGRVFHTVILGFLAAVVLYIPNPVWILGRGVAALERWGIMTLPFVLPVAALGLKRIPTDSRRVAGVLVVVLLVSSTAFVSIGAGFTAPSLADATGHDREVRKHFTAGNLDAADHVLEHTDEQSVYTSAIFSAYLSHQSWSATDDNRPVRFTTMRAVDGRLVSGPGLTVIESGSLRENRIKIAVEAPRSGTVQENVTVRTPVSTDTVAVRTERRNVVYANTDTVIAFRPAETDTADT